MVGESPRISRTFVASEVFEIIIRAKVDKDSRYLFCPSAYNVSKASEDFPDPERPVTTTSLFLGIFTEIFFKL